jgi:uncharacterized SAM-binding protein YcdF (DUF218 family)
MARSVKRSSRLLAAAAVVAIGLAASVRAGTALVVALPVSAPDLIISLGSHEWERLPDAARHAHAHPAATVLLTVPQTVTVHNCHDCANRTARLGALGVDEDRIRLLTLTGTGTYAEAVAARDFALEHRAERLLIVTSPYHTRRALLVFRKVLGGTGITVGIDPSTSDPVARPERWWMVGYDRAYVVYEWLAAGYYAVKYQVPLTL